MAIADKLNELITQRNNLANNLNTMGVSASQAEKLSTLVPKVLNIQSTPTEITKGIIINECDSDGYPIDVSIVGMTKIPNYYFYYSGFNNGIGNDAWLNRIGPNLHLPSNLTEIGDYSFSQCGVTFTSLPESITKLGNYAFQNCTKLALKSLPSGLTDIPTSCFHYCNELALEALPDGIITIGSNGFNNCINLRISELPSGVKSIGANAFQGCEKITLTSLPNAITSINNNTFYGCTNLAITSLPENLTKIGHDAFANCTNLAITSIPSGITKLDSSVFYRCTSLKELTISGNITSIGNNAFYYCSNLTKIVMPNITAVPTLSNTNALLYTPISMRTGYVYVPDDLVASFQSASNWSNYASQIKGVSEL